MMTIRHEGGIYRFKSHALAGYWIIDLTRDNVRDGQTIIDYGAKLICRLDDVHNTDDAEATERLRSELCDLKPGEN